jgi:hypothetical protein
MNRPERRLDYGFLKVIETHYMNTDFDLRSPIPFDVLNTELSVVSCVLQYSETTDGTWFASYEADRINDSAPNDIGALIEVLGGLTDKAKRQLAECTTREFNVGIECGDTWAYNLALPSSIVDEVANFGCSISVTLYPARKPDGTLRYDNDIER